MKIGDVSEKLNIPTSTIRYYESVGLIDRQSRVSGQRVFDERALLNLRFIQLAQAAGFTLAEIKSLREDHAKGPGPSDLWRPFAEQKRVALGQKMRSLKRMDRVLAALTACECSSLEECVRSAETCIGGLKSDCARH